MGHKVDAATRAKISKSMKKHWKQKRKMLHKFSYQE
jgi:hypothetical protein